MRPNGGNQRETVKPVSVVPPSLRSSRLRPVKADSRRTQGGLKQDQTLNHAEYPMNKESASSRLRLLQADSSKINHLTLENTL